MIKYAFFIFIFFCTANRLLFAVEEFKRLALERETDVNMFSMCQQVDYKKIGRHATLCAELEHRLTNGIMFHTIKAVVDDTLYREATLMGIAQMGMGVIMMMLGMTIYNRYVKVIDYNLPTTSKKTIKVN